MGFFQATLSALSRRTKAGVTVRIVKWTCATSQLRGHYTIRLRPEFTALPAVATSDPKKMGLKALVSHIQLASSTWRIQYIPFWKSTLARLWELHRQMKPVDAARLMIAFSHMQHVDLELLDFTEKVLAQSELEQLLDLPVPLAAQTAQSLGKMQKTATMSFVLRSLVGRAHRLDQKLLIQLLYAANVASCDVSDLVDTAARSFVEREKVGVLTLVEFARCAGILAAHGHCKTGPRTGLSLFFRHVVRRASERPKEFQGCIHELADIARPLGYMTPSFRQLVENPQNA